MRGMMVVLALAWAAPAAGDDLSGWFVRAEAGQAVEVPWVAARVGRILSGGSLALDASVSGSPGQAIVSVTGGVEARAWHRHRVSPFCRFEMGALAESRGRSYAVLSAGGGLAVRLDPSWSLRVGLVRSFQGDGLLGPDYGFVGIERRW